MKIISYLIDQGELRVEPFNKSVNKEAGLSDILDEKVEWFMRKIKAERGGLAARL